MIPNTNTNEGITFVNPTAEPTAGPQSITESNTSALGYLDKALGTLKRLNFMAKPEEGQPIIDLLQEVSTIDNNGALVIARTLQHAGVFNEAVRSQVADMEMGTRYENITAGFDSIIADSKNAVSRIENNKSGFLQRLSLWIMQVRRGSIHDRFEKIRKTYLEVTKDTRQQIRQEDEILEAYLDYRGALKEAEILASKMTASQKETHAEAMQSFEEASNAVSKADPGEETARAQLARDQSQRNLNNEARKLQLINTISENLTIAYTVGDTVILNLKQTHDIKQAVFDKAVIFFSTNESVFTAVDANITASIGLRESHRTVDSLTDGMNRSLEVLAEAGTQVKMDALKTAYGPATKAASVQKLINSMVAFQTEAQGNIRKLREESAKNTEEISQIVETGKQKFAKLISMSA